jgi:hypothetical protein
MSDGMAKNWEIVKAEVASYRRTVKFEWARMKRMPATRKPHVLFGLVPDAHRLMPRTLSYLAVLSLIPVIIAGAWWLV